MRLPGHLPLFWTICLINGVVLVVAALLLLFSPARVSADAVPSEILVIGAGLVVMILTNALLIRWALAPLHRLIARLEDIEHLEPTELPEEGSGPVLGIARSVNGLLDRLAEERRTGDARALAAQEAERHRIAQELHDEVGQSLTVVLLGPQAAGVAAPRPRWCPSWRPSGRVPAPASTTYAGWRGGCGPGVLEDLGLASALAALATDFADHSGASVRRSFAPGLPALSPEAEVVVYRVAQEALTNAARHADARVRRALAARRVGGHVVLEVRDDGRGFTGLDRGRRG